MMDKNYTEREHLLLLFAILVSDENDQQGTYKQRGVIVVYDVIDNERLVGVFNTMNNCAKIMQMAESSVSLLLKSKKLFQERYRIERFFIDEEN